VKLLDITEQPVGYALAKRRKKMSGKIIAYYKLVRMLNLTDHDLQTRQIARNREVQTNYRRMQIRLIMQQVWQQHPAVSVHRRHPRQLLLWPRQPHRPINHLLHNLLLHHPRLYKSLYQVIHHTLVTNYLKGLHQHRILIFLIRICLWQFPAIICQSQ